MPVIHREMKIKGSAEFPTNIYFKMLSLLKEGYGYEIKKYKDWLEINPRSNYHQVLAGLRHWIKGLSGNKT